MAGFDNRYQTYLSQWYEDTVIKGVFSFRVYSNDELIDSLSIVALADFRNKTIRIESDHDHCSSSVSNPGTSLIVTL